MQKYKVLIHARRLRNYNKSKIIQELIKKHPKGIIKLCSANECITGTKVTRVIYDDIYDDIKEVD